MILYCLLNDILIPQLFFMTHYNMDFNNGSVISPINHLLNNKHYELLDIPDTFLILSYFATFTQVDIMIKMLFFSIPIHACFSTQYSFALCVICFAVLFCNLSYFNLSVFLNARVATYQNDFTTHNRS